MLAIKQQLRRISSIRKLNYSSHASSDIIFKPKYCDADQSKILSVLNESNAEQLSRYDISRGRIKSLEVWRTKNGNFQTLDEVLEVEGLGEKVLERFCNSILNKAAILSDNTAVVSKNAKNRRQVLTPSLETHLAERLESAVAINLNPTGVSWVKLARANNELLAWNYESFATLPQKLLPQDIFDVSMRLMEKIPFGDVYVLEATPNMSPQNNKPLPTYSQQLELSSMLLALINTRKVAVKKSNDEKIINKVYYLRSRLPARLFKTLLGNERVTSTDIILKLMNNTETFPCTSVTLDATIRDFYSHQTGINKDLLGQALLLAVTFMDLCVYRNQASYAALIPKRK